MSHPHIKRTWLEWELDGRERHLILVIETDLEMWPNNIDFDDSLLEEVRAAAVAQLRTIPSAISRIKIIPVGAGRGLPFAQ